MRESGVDKGKREFLVHTIGLTSLVAVGGVLLFWPDDKEKPRTTPAAPPLQEATLDINMVNTEGPEDAAREYIRIAKRAEIYDILEGSIQDPNTKDTFFQPNQYVMSPLS